jgi:hypothetical protein
MFGRKARFPFDYDPEDSGPKPAIPKEDLLKECSAYANNCQAMVEEAIVKSQRDNRLRADKELYGLSYQPGDLVLMHIPRVKRGVSARLRYQTTCPYQVLPHLPASRPNPDGSYNTYRVKHLGSGNETTVNVRQMLPYISQEAHSLQTPATPAAAPDSQEVGEPVEFDPGPGDFVLLPNQDGVPFHLLQIVSRDGRMTEAQYLNTTQATRERGFRLCWQHDTEKEVQANLKPRKKGYEAWTDDFAIEEFCQKVIKPKKLGAGTCVCYNLSKAEIRATLGEQPL